MQVTIADILRMQPSLEKLLVRNMPIKYSFQIARLIKAFESELDTFYAQRQKLFDQYAAKDENGEIAFQKDAEGKVTGVQIEEQYIETFAKEMDACTNLPLDINAKKIDVSELELFLTVEDVLNLEPIIDMVLDEETKE